MGAVLTQADADGQRHPICYGSRKFTKRDQIRSTTERKMTALVRFVVMYRHYLYGHKTTVVTDHRALTQLLSLKDPSGKLMRWALRLLEFDLMIQHCPGKDMVPPDHLSREGALHAEEAEPTEELPEHGIPGLLSLSQVQLQQDDENQEYPCCLYPVQALIDGETPHGVLIERGDGYLIDISLSTPCTGKVLVRPVLELLKEGDSNHQLAEQLDMLSVKSVDQQAGEPLFVLTRSQIRTQMESIPADEDSDVPEEDIESPLPPPRTRSMTKSMENQQGSEKNQQTRVSRADEANISRQEERQETDGQDVAMQDPNNSTPLGKDATAEQDGDIRKPAKRRRIDGREAYTSSRKRGE